MKTPHDPSQSRRVTTRRRFLKTTGSTVAGVSALGFPAIVSARSPNDKLNIAIIGSGGRGGGNLKAVETAGENIVALCDVNANNLVKAAEKHPQARRYKDYRQLHVEMDDIDAVVISVPEHVHAFATLPALREGKHVYCEKPLTRDVYEARVVTEAAAKAGVATQMGTQIHSGDNYRRVVELVQSGAIGHVREAHVWVSRAWGWHPSEAVAKENKDFYVADRPKEEMTPPDYLDWDLWIGPAPYRPFNEIYFPGPKWYRWWDFGNGTMSDLGSHWNDLPFWALNLDAPTSVEADGPPAHPEIAPASMSAKYEFPARGDRPALSMTWHQGTHKPKIWTESGIPQWANGHLFIGDEGMILSDYGKHVLLPEEKFENFTPPKPWIPASPGHQAEWIQACKTGSPTGSHFGYAGPLTETNHLGNVAYRAGKRIEWDVKNMKITNAPEADKYISRKYRDGWVLA